MTQNIFQNKQTFRQGFEQGLVELLKHDELGVFILVLANASFDDHVHHYTEKALLNKYEMLCTKYREAIEDGIILTDPDDDLMVFLKLLAIGIDNIKPTAFRREQHWELQFNHLRSLRPGRMTHNKFSGIFLNYDEEGFNFNKPFLQKEKFWEGMFEDKKLSVFYNKFPFARFHSLLVPEQEKGLNQYLNEEYHHYIWNVAQSINKTIPGSGIAYNSYGAFCSINHLHFHFYIKDHKLPVMFNRWQHNGGDEIYPIEIGVFDDAAEAWKFISLLNSRQTPYNLIYQDHKIYGMPRKHQSEMICPGWCNGLGWYEVSGGFTTFNYGDFTSIQENTLFEVLSGLKV